MTSAGEKGALLLAETRNLGHVVEKLIQPGYGFVLVVARLEDEGELIRVSLVSDTSNMPRDVCMGIHRRMAAPHENARLLAELCSRCGAPAGEPCDRSKHDQHGGGQL